MKAYQQSYEEMKSWFLSLSSSKHLPKIHDMFMRTGYYLAKIEQDNLKEQIEEQIKKRQNK